MMNDRDILGGTGACACGMPHTVPVRRMVVESGAIGRAGEIMRSLGLSGAVFLAADATTHEVAGRELAALLSAEGFTVHPCILPEHPSAGDQMLDFVREAYRPSEAIISCGSGTVTDLAKVLADERGVPLVVVATAPSMNGYASSVAAILRGGIKESLPVRPALAVIADIDILAAAPLPMIRAGLGDALAKPLCSADWRLAHRMRGTHFCAKAVELNRGATAELLTRAGAIGRREPAAITALTEALLYSGVSMILAGSSLPASGGEHLISHTLDMRAQLAGRAADFHGAQVGVATLLTARLYERLFALDRCDVAAICGVAGRLPNDEGLKEEVRNFFGPHANSILMQYRKKALGPADLKRDRELLTRYWDELRSDVDAYLVPAATIAAALGAAGAKLGFRELGIERYEFVQAVRLARTIRPRFNILDAAWELGMLDDLIAEAT